MEPDSQHIAERGVVTLPDDIWEKARRRADIIGPLAALASVGHHTADEAAQTLGLSRRQVYALIRRARLGSGLVTDMAPGQSGGGKGKAAHERCVVVVNFTPEALRDYRVGVPAAGAWRELINTDARDYGGSGVGNEGRRATDDVAAHGYAQSLALTLPPLGAVVLALRDHD